MKYCTWSILVHHTGSMCGTSKAFTAGKRYFLSHHCKTSQPANTREENVEIFVKPEDSN